MKKLIISLTAVSLPMSLSAQIVINELLYDPSPGNDVNGDGNASTSEDEFVEVVNTGESTVDIGNYTITDASGNTFTFPEGTMIASNEAILVFNGGAPAATINGAIVFIGCPSLNNGGDTITLFDAAANQLDQVVWTSSGVSADESYNRSPDLFGSFVPHSTVPGAIGTESPGTSVSGGSFDSSLPEMSISPSTSSISESGAGSTTNLTVTLAEAPDAYPVVVTLTSDDLTEATVPGSFEIASGLTGVFTVTGVDDPDPDGDREVTISATADGYRPSSATVTVTDDGDTGEASMSPILFTQYHEGFSNNKYLELTNVSDAEVDLSGFILTRWANASTEDFKTAGSFPSGEETLSGVLPAGASFVIANGSATTPIPAGSADLISTATFFNGDDSVVLYQGAVDPANIADALSFTDDGNEGNDRGFVRQNNLIGYNLDAGSSILDFPVVWQEIPIQDADAAVLGDDNFIGSSSLGSNSPLLGFTVTSGIASEADGSIELDVQILNPDGNAVSVDVALDTTNSTASAADLGNYSTQTLNFPAGAASGDSLKVTVNLTDDSEEEAAESAIFILNNVVTGGGARVGGASSFNLSLQDNDTIIPPIYISEIADPQDSFEARYVELFNPTSEPIDLAAGNWNLVYYVNASSAGTPIPLTGVIPANGTYVVANNLANFTTAYPDAPSPDQEDDTINSNGDDNIELRFGGGQNVGALVDVYGVPGTDGTDQEWEFLDSRVERIVGAPNSTFTIGEWSITPAVVADMTPGVHGGGPIGGTNLEVVSFSIDQDNGTGVLTVRGLGTKVWLLQGSNDLGALESWQTLPGGFTESDNPDGSTNLTFFDTFSTTTKRFYRLIEQ